MLQRIRVQGDAPLRGARDYVLYWMVASRRTRHNFALDHAIALAKKLGKPLVVFEPLRLNYPHASLRHHQFVLEGMRDNRAALAPHALYLPYVEPEPSAGRGLLRALAERACVVVSDDWPSSFIPQMQASAAALLDVQLVLVDSNGLVPLRAPAKLFTRAVDFRRFVQKHVATFLGELPRAEPFSGVALPRLASVDKNTARRWLAADLEALLRPGGLDRLPIDHAVQSTGARGGSVAGENALRRFVQKKLGAYAGLRNDPDEDATSHLSAYLHFGHLGAHEIFARVTEREDFALAKLGKLATGKREGFWGVSDSAAAYLDQLVVWRELGFNMSVQREDAATYDATPDWAKKTLAEHLSDPRPELYDKDALERGATSDPLWNAAQRELTRDGRIQGYLRMLWGKKVLEWSESPRQAFETLVYLNDKYALDGRDPNSYSGIGWIFGRYDRPWAPKRPIFGSVRYMSSKSAMRKLRLRDYLGRYGGGGALGELFPDD